jgi:hypothetical protein
MRRMRPAETRVDRGAKHRMLDQYDAQQGMASAVDDWLLDRLGVRRGNDAGGEEGA